MRYVASNTTIPVPRVCQTRRGVGDEYEIVMNYVRGESLDTAWAKLTHDQRIATCHQLRGYLSQLKRLKGKRIKAVSGGRVTVGLRFPKQGGPFNSEKEFNDFMVEKDNDRTPAVFKRYARAGLKDNHVMHFAHGDFSLCNILVDGTGRVAAVLDWDRAGWYPEYWDTARMLSENPGIRDYWPYLEHILLLQYAQEVVALSYVFSLSGDG